VRTLTGPAPAAAADWLRRGVGRLIAAVDPAPDTVIPRVPLDTLLDDADSSGVAAGSDRAADPRGSQSASR
jgi:hypothetical protein